MDDPGQRLSQLSSASHPNLRPAHFPVSLIHTGARYLEVGLWMGSTFCAALANNSVDLAIGVDDWSQFTGPRDTFHTNLDKCVGGQSDRVSGSDAAIGKKTLRGRGAHFDACLAAFPLLRPCGGWRALGYYPHKNMYDKNVCI